MTAFLTLLLLLAGGASQPAAAANALVDVADGTRHDELGNLRHVILPNGDEIDYIIDGRGRRVARNVNAVRDRGWLYGDALNPLAELDDHGDLTKVFVYASQPHVPDLVVTPTDTYRVITDQIGSVRYVLNTRRGIVAQRFEYDPFGNIIDAEGDPTLQPFRFAGGLYDDATGLLRFGARDYDPQVGRWTAKDPALFGGGQTNLYGYAFNDPINYADISGEVPIPLIVFAIGLALVLPSDSGSDPNGDPTGFFAVCAGPAIDAAVGFAISKLFSRAAGAASGGGARSINVFGEGEALPRYLDVAADAAFANGRPLTQDLASESVENIFLRSAPINPTTAAEMARLVAPGGRINVVLPAGSGQAHVGRLTAALGSRVQSIIQRTFTSRHFAPGVDMVQFTIRVAP